MDTSAGIMGVLGECSGVDESIQVQVKCRGDREVVEEESDIDREGRDGGCR